MKKDKKEEQITEVKTEVTVTTKPDIVKEYFDKKTDKPMQVDKDKVMER